MKRPAVIAIFIIAATGLGLLSACDLGDIMRAKVPISVQKDRQLPPSLSLNDSYSEYERAKDDFIVNMGEWQEDIEKAEWERQIFSALAMQGLEKYVGPAAAAAIPGGGLLVAALGSFMIGGAGRKKDQFKSYEKGRTDLMTALQGMGVKIPDAAIEPASTTESAPEEKA